MLTACGSKKDSDLRKSVVSWDASIALAGDSYLHREVPAHYLRDAAKAAVESLEKEQQSAKDASRETSRICAESIRAMKQIGTAVEDHDNASIQAALLILHRDQRQSR